MRAAPAQVLLEPPLVGGLLAQPQRLEAARGEVGDRGDELQVLLQEGRRTGRWPSRATQPAIRSEAGGAPLNHSGAHRTDRTLPSSVAHARRE